MAKSWVGLDQYHPINMDRLLEDLNTVNSDVLNQNMTEKSITCLKNDLNLLPINDVTKRIAVLSIESEGQISELAKMCRNYAKADFFHIPKNAGDSIVKPIFQQLANYDIVIAGIHLIDKRASKNYGLNPQNTNLIADLAGRQNVILCLLGNPFILNKIPELAQSKTLLLGYQQSSYTEKAVGQMIFGALSPEGQLSIGMNDNFKVGMSRTYEKTNRLTYGLSEQVGIRRSLLNAGIDSLIFLGLAEKAFPGAVVQVAKDGKVIFSKSYGFHTYEDAEKYRGKTLAEDGTSYSFINDAMDNPENLTTTLRPSSQRFIPVGRVKDDDIFDLASVTKISTSTLAVMQLMSDGRFDLEDKYGDYFPPFKNTDKGNLIMRDLLTHRAGLKAWIPFWRDAVDTISTMKKALELNPQLDTLCIVKIHKPGFFKRLFGKKTTKEVVYLESLTARPDLWAKMLRPETRRWKKDIFSDKYSTTYSVKIDNSLFLNHNYKKFIFEQIASSPLMPDQGYVYSDLHYYVYPDMIGRITGKTFEKYLDETYASIGASTLTFNPSAKFPLNRIIPTEYDSLFRQTQIHGFVHDEGAAMLGGVSGHAGLFGTANDLTKLMQMYLQKGSYGGQQFIKPEVLDICTSYQFAEEKNRRGIGFDKKDFNPEIKNAPSLASDNSFGHSGYTGTFTWVDPQYNLVYVVMTNRVYPTRNNNKIGSLNIRSAIGDQIIKSIRAGMSVE